jgi:hypothetical protein
MFDLIEPLYFIEQRKKEEDDDISNIFSMVVGITPI